MITHEFYKQWLNQLLINSTRRSRQYFHLALKFGVTRRIAHSFCTRNKPPTLYNDVRVQMRPQEDTQSLDQALR